MFSLLKRKDYPELKEEFLVLCREWFQVQIGHLPPDELPPQSEIEQDISEMRDDTLNRIRATIRRANAIRRGQPDDAANADALTQLIEAYSGHEAKTPVFTRLALSKCDEPRYHSGWPLCAVRLIAETWLEQSVAP